MHFLNYICGYCPALELSFWRILIILEVLCIVFKIKNISNASRPGKAFLVTCCFDAPGSFVFWVQLSLSLWAHFNIVLAYLFAAWCSSHWTVGWCWCSSIIWSHHHWAFKLISRSGNFISSLSFWAHSDIITTCFYAARYPSFWFLSWCFWIVWLNHHRAFELNTRTGNFTESSLRTRHTCLLIYLLMLFSSNSSSMLFAIGMLLNRHWALKLTTGTGN